MKAPSSPQLGGLTVTPSPYFISHSKYIEVALKDIVTKKITVISSYLIAHIYNEKHYQSDLLEYALLVWW